MEQQISRSEQKRRAKSLEDLAAELADLSVADIKRLPCDDFLKALKLNIFSTPPISMLNLL